MITLAYVDACGAVIYDEWQVAKGTTVFEAIKGSTFAKHPDFAQFCSWACANSDKQPIAKHWLVGIFGQKKPVNFVLSAGDRIEIYRPLLVDPNHRRQRVAKR